MNTEHQCAACKGQSKIAPDRDVATASDLPYTMFWNADISSSSEFVGNVLKRQEGEDEKARRLYQSRSCQHGSAAPGQPSHPHITPLSAHATWFHVPSSCMCVLKEKSISGYNKHNSVIVCEDVRNDYLLPFNVLFTKRKKVENPSLQVLLVSGGRCLF